MDELLIKQLVFIVAGLYSIQKYLPLVKVTIRHDLLAMLVCFLLGIPAVLYNLILYIRTKLKNEDEPQNLENDYVSPVYSEYGIRYD